MIVSDEAGGVNAVFRALKGGREGTLFHISLMFLEGRYLTWL